MTKRTAHVVGAGITGATIARRLADAGYKVFVSESQAVIGGLCADSSKGLQYFGPHILHTNNSEVIEFLQQFTAFIPVKHIVGLNTVSGQYTFPFTLYEAKQIDPSFSVDNFYKDYPDDWSYEDYMIAKVGKKIYELAFKPYSENFWGCEAKYLSQSLGHRVSLREDADCYFSDKYVGLPINGFKAMIRTMLDHPQIFILNKKANHANFNRCDKDKVYVTAPIDDFFDYRFGELKYVEVIFSVREETCDYRKMFTENGLYTVNHISTHMNVIGPICYRSSNMYRHYGHDGLGIVTESIGKRGGVKTHPLLEGINSKHPLYEELKFRLSQYTSLVESLPNCTCCGRLGLYKYMNMDKCVEEALKITENI